MAKTGGAAKGKPKGPTKVIAKKRPIMGGTVIGLGGAGAGLGSRAASAGQTIAQFGPAAVVPQIKGGLAAAGISRPGVAKRKASAPGYSYRTGAMSKPGRKR